MRDWVGRGKDGTLKTSRLGPPIVTVVFGLGSDGGLEALSSAELDSFARGGGGFLMMLAAFTRWR